MKLNHLNLTVTGAPATRRFLAKYFGLRPMEAARADETFPPSRRGPLWPGAHVVGLVAVDALARTSVPGVYAAGDVAVAPQQVAVALGGGHVAGVSATRQLLLGRGAQS